MNVKEKEMWEYSGVKIEPQLQSWMRRAIEEITYNTIQNYMNNRFEFVEVKKDDSTRHKPVL